MAMCTRMFPVTLAHVTRAPSLAKLLGLALGLCKRCLVFTRGLQVSVPPGPREDKGFLSQLWLEGVLTDL